MKFTVYPIYRVLKRKKKGPGRSHTDLSEFNDREFKNKKVLPISYSIAWKVAYHFDCEVLYPPILTDKETTEYVSTYPDVNWANLTEIIRKYEIEYIIAEDQFLDQVKTNRLNSVSSSSEEKYELRIFKVA